MQNVVRVQFFRNPIPTIVLLPVFLRPFNEGDLFVEISRWVGGDILL